MGQRRMTNEMTFEIILKSISTSGPRCDESRKMRGTRSQSESTADPDPRRAPETSLASTEEGRAAAATHRLLHRLLHSLLHSLLHDQLPSKMGPQVSTVRPQVSRLCVASTGFYMVSGPPRPAVNARVLSVMLGAARAAPRPRRSRRATLRDR